MALSMYDVSIGTQLRGLASLAHILAKGAAYAEEKGLPPSHLVEARLYEDMLPLSKQVQIASDTAKGCAARLAGIDVPSYPDTETTFPELIGRVNKTVEFLKSVSPAQLEGSETRPIELAMRTRTLNFTGASYLLGFVQPNFYFHVATAYDILRHNGVPLGKIDYLGGA